MAVQDVREQNLDADGIIRVCQQGPVFVEPSPSPMHYFRGLYPKATVAEAGELRSTVPHLAITSVTLANQDSEPHFFKLTFQDLVADTSAVLTEVLVAGVQTLHLPYPHPIVLPLVDRTQEQPQAKPATRWSVVASDEGSSAALFFITVIGYWFYTKK